MLSYTDLSICLEGLGGTNQVLFELMYKSKRWNVDVKCFANTGKDKNANL